MASRSAGRGWRRYCRRWGCGVKKTLHAIERDGEASQARRREYLAALAEIAPDRLIFLDESGVTTSLTRLYGRSAGGSRIHEGTPGGRWSVLTLLGALRLNGVCALMTIPAPADGDIFLAFVGKVLAPALRPGDVLVLDNLSVHKVAALRPLAEQHGARLLYLPPYSPDLNPIEKAWSKLKTGLRAAKARSHQALEDAIAAMLPSITAADAAAWFRGCGIGLQQP